MNTVRLGLITTLAALLAGAVAATAAPASVSTNVNLRSGPSTQHPVIGSLWANNAVDVGQCSAGWCQVTTPGLSGWVASDYVVIGRQAQAQAQFDPGNGLGQPGFDLEFNFGRPVPPPRDREPFPPPPPPPAYDDEEAGACFYTRPDFRGEQFCVTEGETYDYLPPEWDDSFRSVEIYGGARVDVCRDEDLSGACATLRRDTARLPRELDRRISSLEAY